MKVRDIKSYFKSPGTKQDEEASSGSPSNVVQVPSKLSRGRRPPSTATTAATASSSASGSASASADKPEKKGKKTSQAEEDDDVEEDPIPKAAKKSKTNREETHSSSKTNKKGDPAHRGKVTGKEKKEVLDEDEESPIPKKQQSSKSLENKKPETKSSSSRPADKEVKKETKPDKQSSKKHEATPSPRKSQRLQNTPDSSQEKSRDRGQTPASTKAGRGESSKRKLQLDDDDDEDPIPISKSAKPKAATKKARPLIVSDSDSDEEILKATPTSSPKKKPAQKPAEPPSKKPMEFKEPKSNEKKSVPQAKAAQVTPKASSKGRTETKKTPDTKPPVDTKTPEEKKAAQKSNYFKMLSRGGPKHLGSKEMPVGADGCFNGLTFVQTGVLDSFEHDDIKNTVEKYGGRVTSAVSRKTSYLLMGDEPGQSKSKKAKELGVPIIGEDDFLEMIRKSNPDGQSSSQTMFGVDDNENEVEEETKPIEKIPSPVKKGVSPKKETNERMESKEKPSKSKSRSPEKKPKPEMKSDSQESSTSSQATTSTSVTNFSSLISSDPAFFEETWVEKYRPKAMKSLVGQAGDRSNANKLLRWLKNWFQYHGKSDDKAKSSWPGLKDPDGKTFKAALLSGPPGIGKTTMAHLMCKEVGLDYIELNASDTRNKKGLHEILSSLLSSKSLNDVQSKDNELSQMARKHVLIMDEVDGMSGNEDRGGIQELIGLIKTSRIPIICICNDRNHQRIRSLANYCFDLRCSKPTIEQLKGFIQSICFKEKMKVPYDSILKMVKSTDFDIRQIINQLQLLKETDPDNQTVYNPRKDIVLGPWDVVRKVFSASEHVGMSLQDKNNLFFQDYSFGPLFVQENYTKWVPVKARGNKYKTMDLLRDAAESIATGDLVDSVLRRTNNWSLLPTQAVFASILPGEIMEGQLSDGIEFPRWLGKNSNRNKVSRILQQLHTHVHLQISGSLEALNLDYLPYLRRSIINPLAAGHPEESAKAMQDYDLLREDLDNINELTLWPGMRNPLDNVDSKTKAAFTRQVNKEILPYSVVKVTKGRGKAKADEELEGLEGEDEGAAEEEEEETVDTDAMIKKKTRSKASATASTSKAKAKSSKPGTSTSDKKSKAKPKAKRSRGDSEDEDEDKYESDFIDDSDDESDDDLHVSKASSKKRKPGGSHSTGSKSKRSRE